LNGYYRLRQGLNTVAITRARTECVFAILAWIDTVAAEAAAEDRQDPAFAASASAARQVFKVAGPCNAACEHLWRSYQAARKCGGEAAITAARAAWRDAFVVGCQELAVRWAKEDDRHVEELHQRLDEGHRLKYTGVFRALR
jgi:hypothetical protein